MLIVALNVKNGGGKRAAGLSAWLLREEPDLVVLPEWQNNLGGQKLVTAFSEAGYALASQSGTSDGLLVASRIPIMSHMTLTPSDTKSGQLMLLTTAEFDVLCSYFPNDNEKRPFFAQCAEAADTHPNRPLLLIGDFNTGHDEVDRTPGSMPLSCAAEFGALANAGMIDLWRSQHGPQAREYSWSTIKSDYRIDHALANIPFVALFGPLQCWYDHQPRGARLTDHSAILLRSGVARL
jgi:exodeoxyribonuclease-3